MMGMISPCDPIDNHKILTGASALSWGFSRNQLGHSLNPKARNSSPWDVLYAFDL